MDFNIKKCKVMRISKKAQAVESDLCMNESPLKVVSEFNDLCLLVDSNLSWNILEHCIVSKAIKMLGLISRTCTGFDDVKTLNTHFAPFFLSQLEHGSVVWSPYTQQNIDMIEHAQRRATRLILKSDIDYASRVKKLNLQTLEQRRFIADVIFLYKALNGYLNVDLSKNSHFYSMHHARF